MDDKDVVSMRKPVMLMVGEFRAGSTERGLVEGFRRLGWAVQEVDRGRYSAGVSRALLLRIASRLSMNAVVRAFQQAVLCECAVLRPDVLLAVKGTDLTGAMLEQISEAGARTVMYYPDVAFNHRGVDEASFRGYDLFATTKSFQVPWLKETFPEVGVEHIAHGYVDRMHVPLVPPRGGAHIGHDVLYAGHHSSYKQQWLLNLLAHSPGLDLAVIGNRWRQANPVLTVPPKNFLGERVGLAYAQAIQSAKVNIALHFGTTNSQWQDLVSTRTFEIPACRGFMLHIDNDEVREYFEPGKEIDVFSTPEELADKIQFYLARPELREKMIERAYARCVPAYGYVRRAAEIQEAMIRHGLIDATRFMTEGVT